MATPANKQEMESVLNMFNSLDTYQAQITDAVNMCENVKTNLEAAKTTMQEQSSIYEQHDIDLIDNILTNFETDVNNIFGE